MAIGHTHGGINQWLVANLDTYQIFKKFGRRSLGFFFFIRTDNMVYNETNKHILKEESLC